MKVTYSATNTNVFTLVNIFSDENDIKNNTTKEKFLNIKVEELLNERKFIKFIRSIVMKAKAEKIENLSFDYRQIRDMDLNKYDSEWRAKNFIENILLAWYTFDTYKTKKENKLKNFLIVGDFTKEEVLSFKEAEIIANSVTIARDLSNTPGNDMTPTILASEARKLFSQESKVNIKIVNETECKKLGMNLFCAVGSGSQEESKLIVLEYMNGNKKDRPIVLIGKGITFDTGGLNLKLKYMNEMVMDMTGGATVLSALKGVAGLGLKKNVVVIVPAVENAISGSSYRPGDIIKSMEGITVEIDNTDAEGRLVLADAITYSKRYNPKVIVDVATLTGAALSALGERASVLMSRNKSLSDALLECGERTGEYLWPLPVWEEYREDIKSKIADIKNCTDWGGAITAGMFLYEFADKIKDCDLAHIDIAPRMASIESDNLEKGATGEPVKLLIEFVKTF